MNAINASKRLSSQSKPVRAAYNDEIAEIQNAKMRGLAKMFVSTFKVNSVNCDGYDEEDDETGVQIDFSSDIFPGGYNSALNSKELRNLASLNAVAARSGLQMWLGSSDGSEGMCVVITGPRD